MESGYFIVFEGPEGAGKSSQIARLAIRLKQAGFRIVTSREPGGTPASDAIREVILDPGLTIDPLPEFLLYSASRAQHVSEVIKPALARGAIVISDRFFGASVAYQGYGRGLDLAFIETLNARVSQGLSPTLTLLLDLDVSEGLGRVAARGRKDRLELADLSFHERVRKGFLTQAQADPTWVVIDAARDEDAVSERIWQVVEERIRDVPSIEGKPG